MNLVRCDQCRKEVQNKRVGWFRLEVGVEEESSRFGFPRTYQQLGEFCSLGCLDEYVTAKMLVEGRVGHSDDGPEAETT